MMTVARITIMERLEANGDKPYSPIEYNFKPKKAMLERLVEAGFAERYTHGGYLITDAGREALRKAKGKAQS